MALSPEDIVNHEFRQALRGYAVQEVDDLLDRLADQVERAERDIAELRQQLVDADARTAEALVTESSLKRTLITAQDAAQRTVDEAQTHAETVRADAEREVAQRLDEMLIRSTAMLEEAEDEASAIRSSGRSEQEAVSTRLAELADVENRYRTELRAMLQGQLATLERLEVGPDATPDGVDEPGDPSGLVPFGGLTVGGVDAEPVRVGPHGPDGEPHDGHRRPDHDAPT